MKGIDQLAAAYDEHIEMRKLFTQTAVANANQMAAIIKQAMELVDGYSITTLGGEYVLSKNKKNTSAWSYADAIAFLNDVNSGLLLKVANIFTVMSTEDRDRLASFSGEVTLTDSDSRKENVGITEQFYCVECMTEVDAMDYESGHGVCPLCNVPNSVVHRD